MRTKLNLLFGQGVFPVPSICLKFINLFPKTKTKIHIFQIGLFHCVYPDNIPFWDGKRTRLTVRMKKPAQKPLLIKVAFIKLK